MTALSIIIPHYNSTDTLSKLLDSIPVKKDIQILVIDDHSNQEEKIKLTKIKDSSMHENINFLENDPDKKGAGSSRNVGLRKAVGEWVLFADSDDFFIDGFYDSVKKYFDTNFDVVFFKPTSVELGTDKPSDRHAQFAGIIDEYSKAKTRKHELMLRYKIVVPWSKLIRRSFIEDNEISFENVITANDVMFSANVGNRIETFDVSDNIIYCVTKSPGSLTTSLNNKSFDTRIDVYIRYYHFLKGRLSESDFDSLDLSGQGHLFNSKKYGLKKMYYVVRTLRKNKVRVISKNTFNPAGLTKRISFIKSKHKESKRFYK